MRSRWRARLVLACAAASLLLVPLLAGCGGTPTGSDVQRGGTYYSGNDFRSKASVQPNMGGGAKGGSTR